MTIPRGKILTPITPKTSVFSRADGPLLAQTLSKSKAAATPDVAVALAVLDVQRTQTAHEIKRFLSDTDPEASFWADTFADILNKMADFFHSPGSLKTLSKYFSSPSLHKRGQPIPIPKPYAEMRTHIFSLALREHAKKFEGIAKNRTGIRQSDAPLPQTNASIAHHAKVISLQKAKSPLPAAPPAPPTPPPPSVKPERAEENAAKTQATTIKAKRPAPETFCGPKRPRGRPRCRSCEDALVPLPSTI